jgi:hypothetical protein
MEYVVKVSEDKAGRIVMIASDEGQPNLVLKVGGILGQEEWTWLTPDDALEIASHLAQIANRKLNIHEALKPPTEHEPEDA